MIGIKRKKILWSHPSGATISVSQPRKRLKRHRHAILRTGTRKRRKKGEITKLKAILWQLCRQIIKRDYGNSCYTCGRTNLEGSNRQLGHYIASSLCSAELRFDLKNLKIQCYHCNINLSGNTIQFQKNLIRDFGQEYVEELWNRNVATKGKTHPTTFFQEKIKEYQAILATTPPPKEIQ